MPLFSVVMPSYNRAHLIGKSIQSVLQQTLVDFELIIVDDGSTDNTSEVVSASRDSRILYHKQQNAERAAARNIGVNMAQGNYITFLDSDDIFYPQHLSTAYEFLTRHSHPELFHLGYEIKDINNAVIRKLDRIREINQSIVKGNPLSCMGVFVRKDIMQANLFNEDRGLSALEDWELWIRLAARYPILNDNTITSALINHDERSVLTDNPEKLKQKAALFLRYVSEDPVVQKVYGSRMNQLSASVMTYVALHLAIAGHNKKEVLAFLWAGIRNDRGEVFRKRFFVILKLLAGF